MKRTEIIKAIEYLFENNPDEYFNLMKDIEEIFNVSLSTEPKLEEFFDLE